MHQKAPANPHADDDDQDEGIPEIHYPPNWGQHRSLSPQGAARKMSEGSDESFHSAESHHIADYTNKVATLTHQRPKSW